MEKMRKCMKNKPLEPAAAKGYGTASKEQ